MNVAFFSYEFPGETGGGGIGEYLSLAVKLLESKGHTVTVFTATGKEAPFWESSLVYRIPALNWNQFNQRLPEYFSAFHKKTVFDVAECTDFNGCGLYVKKLFPELPVVVRLHTPLYMVDKILFQPMSFSQKLRFALGSIRKGKWPVYSHPPASNEYTREFDLVELAERVASPGSSIYAQMKKLGFKLEGKTDIIPLPFQIPSRTVNGRQSIKSDPHIIYIGRLESRKGVIDLARAIPVVLRLYPGAKFTFIGESSQSPKRGTGMMEYLKSLLNVHSKSVNFTGKLSHEKVLEYMSAGDLFVFPSHYESFGLACCEAMAAGKAVIGSANGGMAEIIENGKSGLLTSPRDPATLANDIIRIIDNDQLRLELGKAARKRIAEFLDPGRIIDQQIQCYQSAIDSCKSRRHPIKAFL